VLSGAFANLRFTFDPIASSLAESAADAEAVGLLEPVDLEGIYELSILNDLLTGSGEAAVEGIRAA
jgi:NitT/TauT family transport system substrate-binding protein